MRPSRFPFALAMVAAVLPLAVRADPVVLPPFLVQEFKASELQWVHGQDEHLEVLSACDPEESQDFVQQIREQQRELVRVVPEEFLLQTTRPTTLILFPGSLKSQMSAEIVRAMEQSGPKAPDARHFQAMEDLRLSDPDSTFIFVFLDDWSWRTYRWQREGGQQQGDSLVYLPAYVRFLLESRAPALPDWYVTGSAGFYRSITVDAAVHLGGQAVGPVWDYFRPETWVSEEAARALRAHPEAPRTLIPLQELFAPLAPGQKSDEYRQTWAAEAELFVRWALSGKLVGGPAKLRRFVAASAGAPPTEEAFEACFGLDYADALEALSDYLPTAVRDPVLVQLAAAAKAPAMDFQPATPGEVHRLKGEWSRRTLRVVRQTDPQALPLYVDQTRKLLQGAYDHGDRDPRLLASLALFRIDTGDPKGGAALLAADPAAASARPIGLVELARQRLVEALNRPAGGGGALSEDQREGVLGPLALASRQDPPIETGYLLAAIVAEHAGADPTAAERARLSEGARLFPRNAALVSKAAAWDLRAGDASAALRLTELGIAEAANPADRAKLATLRDLAAKVATAAN